MPYSHTCLKLQAGSLFKAKEKDQEGADESSEHTDRQRNKEWPTDWWQNEKHLRSTTYKIPMLKITGDLSYLHWTEPGTFWQTWWQPPLSVLHSSTSTQVLVALSSTYPASHWHSNSPGRLVHCPPVQGLAAHSSISVHSPSVRTYPGWQWQEKLAGRLRQSPSWPHGCAAHSSMSWHPPSISSYPSGHEHL